MKLAQEFSTWKSKQDLIDEACKKVGVVEKMPIICSNKKIPTVCEVLALRNFTRASLTDSFFSQQKREKNIIIVLFF